MLKKIKPTNENLCSFGTKLLMQWLIVAAKKKTTLTYGEIRDRLERECNFTKIGRAGRIGKAVAEPMQMEILEQDSRIPLLNVLVVRKKDRMPGSGECIREIFSVHFSKEDWLKEERALEKHPEKWEEIARRATQEVYDYPDWDNIYKRIFL